MNNHTPAEFFEISKYSKLLQTSKTTQEYRSDSYSDLSFLAFKDFITHFQSTVSSPTVLEIGCGTGHNSINLFSSDSSVFAVDISHACLSSYDKLISPQVRSLTLVDNLFSLIKNPEIHFDLIIINTSFSYFDFNNLLSFLQSKLNKSGAIVIHDTNGTNPLYWIPRYLLVLAGQRTFKQSTNLFTFSKLRKLKKTFDLFDIQFFGHYDIIYRIFLRVFGLNLTSFLSSLPTPPAIFSFKFLLILRPKLNDC